MIATRITLGEHGTPSRRVWPATRMLRRLGRFLCAVLAAAAASGPAAHAAILASQSGVQPSASIVAIGQPQLLVLNWSVVSQFRFIGTTLPYTVTSSSGEFVAAGTVLGTVNAILSGGASATSLVPSTVRFTESVVVPPDVAVKANRLGAATIAYVRQFSDGGIPVALQSNILIGGSGAAQFGITREALAFDDGAVVRVVQAGDPLSATATINYTGSGTMSALWEVAGPSSTAGQPVFRTLQPVTRGLLTGQPEVVKSVRLPTDSPGYYVVRLRITDPLPGFDPPALSYYVGDARSTARGGFTIMTLMGPGEGAVFDRDTRFAWQPVDGANAYKIELFASPAGDRFNLPDLGGPSEDRDLKLARAALSAPPATGMIVAPAQTQAVLSSAARARLQPRQTYFWRVQAIGADGRVIGEGPVRRLTVP